jgi:hypothetical protein
MADYPLGSLGLQIRAHWKRHRPKMYAELEKAGKLQESVYQAQELTNDLMDSLLAKKLPHHQAWELAREEWAFLPSETDSPCPEI